MIIQKHIILKDFYIIRKVIINIIIKFYKNFYYYKKYFYKNNIK